MAGDIHYFGIRHHGPGSARRLLDALASLQPVRLLIEGPADGDSLLPLLADTSTQAPIALLSYVADAPERAVFHPFADFSPEYQAIRWALANEVRVEFIDLPSALNLAVADQDGAATEVDADANGDEASADVDEASSDQCVPDNADNRALSASLRADPIGAIARAAGYDDGESWWHDWIENSRTADDPFAVFEAVAALMATLRENEPALDIREARREAHMRLAINKAARESDGPIAVVCGAWHVPALKARHKIQDDKALLAGLPKAKTRMTWIPWTSPRLASGSGYGAGVDAPRWYAHLWHHGSSGDALACWLVDVARTFRDSGASASSASVIEAVRMADALARLRERPAAGFEEMRDAVIACLCHGESLVWKQFEPALLLGREVGTVPADTPLMPLLEDLQRQQKLTRMKPEALERELSLDLRSDGGAARSTLLHRLALLDVPWGNQADAGGSRGTFRERWVLRWDPEFAVQLAENLVYGTTIEQAATRRSITTFDAAARLSELATLIQACLEAQLPTAVDVGIRRLAERAAHAHECVEMLEALPSLVSLRRYGSAREVALDRVDDLVDRLITQAALAMPYAVRNLDDEQSAAFVSALAAVQQSIAIADLPEETVHLWWQALLALLDDRQANRRILGLATRLLHENGRFDSKAIQLLMGRMLSPGTSTSDAAQFFEGFFDGAAQRLLHDVGLLGSVDQWLLELDNETFEQQLPLLRRVLSTLDVQERRRLFERVVTPEDDAIGHSRFAIEHLDEWLAQQSRLTALLKQQEMVWPT